MSRRTSSRTSKEQIPAKPSTSRSQTSGLRQTSKTSAGSKAVVKVSTTVTKKDAPPVEPKGFELPALSLVYQPKLKDSVIQKMKRTTMRRHAPAGEDLKKIKEILQSLRRKKITVQEFVSLMTPVTADHGEAMKMVMQEDLNSFRKLARKVYETITQDNSDVLLNQQQQLAEYYREKKNLLHDKMMRSIEEIYLLAPKFDFERYAKEKERYLDELFPIPQEVVIEPEEIEMMKRQAAYHRLQWLRSEGERLNEENNSLKKRLNQLKRMHMDEQMRMQERELEAETKKEKLEAQAAAKTEALEKLTEDLEKSIIEKETGFREDADITALDPLTKQELDEKTKKNKKKPKWNEEAAKEIELRSLGQSKAGEAPPEATAPFHFSPVRTPAPAQPRQTSPFHYSPPKTPPRDRFALPQPQGRVATPGAMPIRRRAETAPRDTWGGFR